LTTFLGKVIFQKGHMQILKAICVENLLGIRFEVLQLGLKLAYRHFLTFLDRSGSRSQRAHSIGKLYGNVFPKNSGACEARSRDVAFGHLAAISMPFCWAADNYRSVQPAEG